MSQRAFVLVPLAEIAPHLVPAGSLQAVAGQIRHALTSRVIARMTHRPDHQAIARFVNKRRFL